MNYALLFLVFFPILVGIINYFVGKKYNYLREIIAILASIIELIVMVIVLVFNPLELTFLNFHFKADGFRSLYALIACFMWMCTIIFSKEYMTHYQNKDRYYFFYLLTLGATVGVFLSNDLMTTFMFFEMMSLTSFVLVIHDEKKETIKAALTYLVIAIISGMILLMGMFMVYGELHTLYFDEIYNLCKDGINTPIIIGGILMLLGFGAKAGMYPLHIWLPKAHPVAPAPASALLSGILTKSGIFGIIICCVYIFPSYMPFGWILVVLALITMFLGALLAVFSNNFKRTLACSSMSQIGFILTGLAFVVLLKEENILAFEGSLLHMVNHSLIKLSLFMIAGVIFMNIHKLNLNEIRGFGRHKYVLMVCFILGALGIMGVPGFNGYVSKTLIHEAIIEYTNLGLVSYGLMKTIEWIFLISGGLTVAYMIKIFTCVFIEKNEDEAVQKEYDEKKHYMNPLSASVIILSSIILPFLGFIPQFTSNNLIKLANDFFLVDSSKLVFVNYFSWANIKGGLISIVIGLIVYFGLIRTLFMRRNENNVKAYVELWPSWLDMETLVYKPIIYRYNKKGELNFFSYTIIFITRAIAEAFDGVVYFIRRFITNQYKYRFDGTPYLYKVGRMIDRKTKKDTRYGYRLLERKLIINDVKDTLNATFSFDFLMACIGVVTVILVMLLG